jgi:putative zinc finger/helix-turn-helix YgiT family protein
MEHDGRSYSLTVPNLAILECEACHERVLSDEAFAKVVDELRRKAGLLFPAEIREKRQQLGLKQGQFAELLGVAKETVSRWETGGQIQQRVMDDLIRAFFDLPELRDYLRERRGLSPTETSKWTAINTLARSTTIAPEMRLVIRGHEEGPSGHTVPTLGHGVTYALASGK